jgi:uncharacterized transporter YbjL
MSVMHMVAIGWLFVALMMAVTETSVVAGILSFLFYGLLPLALFWWVIGAPARRARSMRMRKAADQPDRPDAEPDQ